jgi:phosphoserine phosphatase
MSDHARQTRKLERLLEVTRQMAATTDLTQLLGVIIDATLDVLDCERATIFLYDKATDELYSRVATGVESIRFSAKRGIAGAAASARQIVNVPDAYADERFNREIDRQTGFRTRNLLTFPLENLDKELMGVLQALNKVGGPFGPDEERLALVLSAQAGVALHRQRLIEEYALKQRMARDLELARKIQLDTFPKSNPSVPGYEIAGWNLSADETGGDCYDFVPLADGRLAVLLADATGHGIPSALIIAQCRAMTRAMLSVTRRLQDVTSRVNQLLINDIAADRFVTAFLGILDGANHRLEYVAAGQGPIIFIGPDGPKSLPASGLPFAVLDDFDAPPEVFEFAPGSLAVLLTDGFFETEAPNSGGDQFGDRRVIEYLLAHAADPLDKLISGLHDAVREFRKDGKQLDDLTAVLIRRRA